MRRRAFLISAAATASVWMIGPALAAGREMVVYKDPNCGCCHEWAAAMKGAGFQVKIGERRRPVCDQAAPCDPG